MGRPHVEKSIKDSTLARNDIMKLVRNRLNFYSLYALFDWQARAAADLELIQDQLDDLDSK